MTNKPLGLAAKAGAVASALADNPAAGDVPTFAKPASRPSEAASCSRTALVGMIETASKEGVTMRRSFALFLLSICLGLPPVAHAELQASCNLGTLKGRYVFTGRGFIESAQPGIPRV